MFGEAQMGYVQPESDSDSDDDPFASSSSNSESECLSAGSFSELSNTEI